jgi:hypothetical protein
MKSSICVDVHQRFGKMLPFRQAIVQPHIIHLSLIGFQDLDRLLHIGRMLFVMFTVLCSLSQR